MPLAIGDVHGKGDIFGVLRFVAVVMPNGL